MVLCRVFPKLRCDYPKEPDGKLVTRTLTTQEYDAYTGVLGHYHVQTNKSDPGPAMQWDLVINGARELLKDPTLRFRRRFKMIESQSVRSPACTCGARTKMTSGSL